MQNKIHSGSEERKKKNGQNIKFEFLMDWQKQKKKFLSKGLIIKCLSVLWECVYVFFLFCVRASGRISYIIFKSQGENGIPIRLSKFNEKQQKYWMKN